MTVGAFIAAVGCRNNSDLAGNRFTSLGPIVSVMATQGSRSSGGTCNSGARFLFLNALLCFSLFFVEAALENHEGTKTTGLS